MSDLETLYSPSKWSKRLSSDEIFEKHIEYINENSQIVRDSIKCELNIAYGPGKREKIDIIGTDLNDDGPILIHIHGGYYQEPSVTHSNQSFIAKSLYDNKIKCIFLGYELCPTVTVKKILENLGKALNKCLEYAKSRNCRNVFLSGHSVGAHAIATLYSGYIKTLPNEYQHMIKSVFLLSGVYDLAPLTKTSVNKLLNLEENEAKQLSPLHQTIENTGTIFYVIVGEFDSPAFIAQANDFNAYLKTMGTNSHFHLIKNVDHFDIIEKLTDKQYELTKIIVDTIKSYA